eukprot:12503175-Ditylum_brightwellii.AAC.1
MSCGKFDGRDELWRAIVSTGCSTCLHCSSERVVARIGYPILTMSTHAIAKAESSFVCAVESPLGASYTPMMHEAISDGSLSILILSVFELT